VQRLQPANRTGNSIPLERGVEQALLTFTNAPEEILALCSLPTELAKVA
jgi:hypothetical protein